MISYSAPSTDCRLLASCMHCTSCTNIFIFSPFAIAVALDSVLCRDKTYFFFFTLFLFSIVKVAHLPVTSYETRHFQQWHFLYSNFFYVLFAFSQVHGRGRGRVCVCVVCGVEKQQKNEEEENHCFFMLCVRSTCNAVLRLEKYRYDVDECVLVMHEHKGRKNEPLCLKCGNCPFRMLEFENAILVCVCESAENEENECISRSHRAPCQTTAVYRRCNSTRAEKKFQTKYSNPAIEWGGIHSVSSRLHANRKWHNW